MKDLYNNIAAAQVLAPVSISATQSAIEVDLKDCNSAVFLWATGVEAGTLSGSLGWSLTMTHADDNGSGAAGTYANVASSDVQGVTPSSGVVVTLSDPAHDATLYKIGYVGGKRFVKLLITEIGTTTGMPQALLVLKGHLRDAPIVV